MTSLFVQILTMSIVASYVATGVILVRLFIRKAPKIFSYALWSIVLFRLICPFSFESHISLIPKFFETTPRPVSYLQDVNINLSTINGGSIVNRMNQVILPASSETRQTFGLETILSIIWLAGILLLLTFAVISYIRFKRRIPTATLVRDNIYETDLIHTPFVFGWIHPKIYVLTGMKEDEFQYVLLHEQTHIRRRDYWIKPFAFLVLAVYWFNPVIWISYILMSRDMEMSCDESVIKSIKEESKNAYSNLLLSLSIKKDGLMNPLSFGRNNIKTRIKNVLHYKKPPKWVTGVICVFVMIVMVLLISNPIMVQSKIIVENLINTDDSMIIKDTYTLEEAVNQYIKCMKNQNIDSLKKIIPMDIGTDARIYNYEVMSQYAFDSDRISKLASASVDEVIGSQLDFIREKFGEGAWDHVTYIIVKTHCPATKEGYIIKGTEEILTLQGYLETTGLTMKEYVESGLKIPAEVVQVDVYDCYDVYLSFNGESQTDNGENSFKISVDNCIGNYRIDKGLHWNVPFLKHRIE